MTIHVVQTGETISSIADKYKISEDRLILDNGITNPDNLAVGQTIVIIYPLTSYTVQEGDTLVGIARSYQVTLMQLLRNNPHLSDREYIYPGETIIISYDTQKISLITTSGYAYPFIDRDVLKKTLPYLTYLTVFNYRQTEEGNIIDLDDEELIKITKNYGVAPMMLTSIQTDQGLSNSNTARLLLNSPKLQDRLIDNIMDTLKRKGYYGLNQYFQFYTSENADLYIRYVKKLSERLKSEGYRFLVTITPRKTIDETGIIYEENDYSEIIQYVDAMSIIAYNWGLSYGPPTCATPVNLLEQVINSMILTTPPEKIFIGLPVIGYDYPLPYIPGYSKANAITNDIANGIAAKEGVPIQYSEIAKGAYYFYNKQQQEHNVWFKDARSIEAISRLVPKYGLQGLSIWNIMFFFAQMWLVINNEYEIEKLQDFKQI